MPIVYFNSSISTQVDFNMTYDYSNLNVTPPMEKSYLNYYLSQSLTTTDFLLLNYTLPDKTNVQSKYIVNKIYFSREIHAGESHDIELVIQHQLIDNLLDPIKYVYQILTFKNNTKSPLLIDLNSNKKTIIDGNGLLNIHKKNNNRPSIYFIPDLQSSSLTDFLKPTNTTSKSIVFLWTIPITTYQIKSLENINNCDKADNATSAISDWSNIFARNVGDSGDLAGTLMTSLTNIKHTQIKIPNSYDSSKMTFTQELSTDEIYIDCSPINESVENVNYYLEKLNGKNDSISKQFMAMVINSLIIIIVSGSMYFSTPTIIDFFIKIHYQISEITDPESDKLPIKSGIVFGIGLYIVILTIILMSIGIALKKQDVIFASFLFLIISISFIMSVINYEKFKFIYSNNVLFYLLPIPFSWLLVYYFRPSAPPVSTVTAAPDMFL